MTLHASRRAGEQCQDREPEHPELERHPRGERQTSR